MLVTRMCCAKTAEPIEMPFGGGGGLTLVGPRKNVLDGVKIANPFATTRGDNEVDTIRYSIFTCAKKQPKWPA